MKHSKYWILLLIPLIAGAFYFLSPGQTASIEFYAIKAQGEGSPEGAEVLLFDEGDMKSYTWARHEIEFTEAFLRRNNVTLTDALLYEGGSEILDCSMHDNFAVYVNGEKQYEGRFEQAMYTSYLPDGPILSDTKNGVQINVSWGDDPRSNDSLYNALKENRLLR